MIKQENWKSWLLCSALATSIAEFATVPICTMKTVYQTEKQIASFKGAAKWITEKQGIMGFFRSSPLSISGQVYATCSKYTLYRQFQSIRIGEEKTKLQNKILDSMIANLITSITTHPIDQCKVMIQKHQSIRREYGRSKYGPLFFYRGYTKSIGKLLVGSATFLPIYETLNDRWNNVILASFCTSIISTCAMQPFDYLKTIQMCGEKHDYKKQPLSIYCRGLGLNLIRIVPHFTIGMSLLDYFLKIF